MLLVPNQPNVLTIHVLPTELNSKNKMSFKAVVTAGLTWCLSSWGSWDRTSELFGICEIASEISHELSLVDSYGIRGGNREATRQHTGASKSRLTSTILFKRVLFLVQFVRYRMKDNWIFFKHFYYTYKKVPRNQILLPKNIRVFDTKLFMFILNHKVCP